MPDLVEIIKTIGMLGVWGVVFAESGLLIGFFFPGDSLLFTSGFLASQGFFNITILTLGFFLAAVIGDNVGYAFGHRVGRKLFERKNSLFFHKDNLLKAQEFYKKHGKKTIVIARFIPAVRTFAPIVAGISDMEYKTFFAYNIIGGLLWAVGLTMLGYWLGSTVKDIDHYLLPIVGFIIILSIMPNAYHILKSPSSRKQLLLAFNSVTQKIFKK